MPHFPNFTTWPRFVMQAVVIGLVTMALLLLMMTVYYAFFNVPPVRIVSLDPPDLGELCPGQQLTIHNHVLVEDSITLIYYTGTMDTGENFNYPGTQTTFSGFMHPHASNFQQEIPWVVPDLPPGEYMREFGVRGTRGDQSAVYVGSTYRIGADCHPIDKDTEK